MDLPIICNGCGAYLDGSINQKGELEIDWCPDCEKAIREEEREKGYDEGYEEGNKE